MTHVQEYLLLTFLLSAAMAASVAARKLTPAAAVTGGVTGVMVYAGAGFTGIGMVALFFLLGTLATSWKKDFKEQNGLSEPGSNRRHAGQVLANAGTAAVCGLCGYLFAGHTILFRLMMAASLAAAAADTMSSELGNVYGRRFYNITSFRKDIRGLDGVVSLEGTLIGMAGSTLIALLYMCGYGWSWYTFLILLIAGTAGNITDSVLGALLERRHIIDNDIVNACNTVSAALITLLLLFISGSV